MLCLQGHYPDREMTAKVPVSGRTDNTLLALAEPSLLSRVPAVRLGALMPGAIPMAIKTIKRLIVWVRITPSTQQRIVPARVFHLRHLLQFGMVLHQRFRGADLLSVQ